MTTPPPASSERSPEPELPAWAKRKQNPSGLPEEQLSVFIGPKWATTYRAKLQPFVDDPAFVPTWNWAAACFGSLWFLYRKLYLAFAAFTILPSLAFNLLTKSDVQITATTLRDPANEWLAAMYGAVLVSSMIAAGGTANWFLFRRARAAIRLVQMQGLPPDQALILVERIGGVNRRGALFLILLGVVLTFASLRA